MIHILRCQQCGNYTMKEQCACGAAAVSTKPVRYTQDNISKYRREARREDLKQKGLL
ncbi:ribosome biogenesis protein [Candidatus Woesearchaeota archaeon]|nr:ribosome biogenesis protein [Candidatus Woesearchaeota archaeon]